MLFTVLLNISSRHFILSLPEEVITNQDFETLLAKKKIKRLDKDLVGQLMSQFVEKKTKVNCIEMQKAYLALYPETVLPPPKEKKKNQKNKSKKKKKAVEEEKELAVHDLETQYEEPVTVEKNNR